MKRHVIPAFNRPTIDFLVVLGILGAFVFFMGFALLLPIIIDLVYGEDTWKYFAFSASIAFVSGGALWALFKPKKELRIREGFLVVSLTWLILSLVGALPYIFSGVMGSYTDAVFETMNGLTTTGSTVLGGISPNGFTNPDIESIPHSLLFWRSLSQWLGGMGIIVLSIALLPLLGVGGMQLFHAESPGPQADKIAPRVQETAKLLWGVYMAFTVTEFLLLWVHPSMNWYDALNHSMTTMATGGFSTKNASISAFNSSYIDWVITFFMFMGGVSFALHFRLLSGNTKAYFENRELRFYTLVTALATVGATLSLFLFDGYNILDALRNGAFQVVSIITTTGFGTDNYEMWHAFGAFLIFLLFFTGGSAGSTSGGIKMIRWMILIRNSGREIRQIIHPKAVLPIRIGNKTIHRNTQRTVLSFFILYMLIFAIGALLISMLGYDFKSAIGASITALGNIGPAFGEFGPANNFAAMPYFGKWVLIVLMMTGRLEIITILIIFSPSFWKQ